jgi:hypothetical protein
MRRERQRVLVDDDVDDHRAAGGGQRLGQARAQLSRILDADALGPDGLGDLGEVRVGQVGTERDQTRLLLLSGSWPSGWPPRPWRSTPATYR